MSSDCNASHAHVARPLSSRARRVLIFGSRSDFIESVWARTTAIGVCFGLAACGGRTGLIVVPEDARVESGPMEAAPPPIRVDASSDAAADWADVAVETGVADVREAGPGPLHPCSWCERFGGPGRDVLNALAADDEGNLVIAGTFDSTIDFGAVRLTASPRSTDVFLAKLTRNGQPIWSRRFGGAQGQVLYDIALDDTGAIYAAGAVYQGTLDLGAGPLTSLYDWVPFVAKFDGTGAVVWNHAFGTPTPGASLGIGIAVNADHEVYFAGHFEGTLDLGGGPLVASTTEPNAWSGSPDVFVAKFDSDIAAAPSGVVLTGTYGGATDFGGGPLSRPASPVLNEPRVFVAKLDARGAYQSAVGYGWSDVARVRTDRLGNMVLTGWFARRADVAGTILVSRGGRDAILVLLDPSGEERWLTTFGGTGWDEGNDVTFDSRGRIVVAGYATGPVTIGGTATTGGPGKSAVLASTAVEGDGLTPSRYGGAGEQNATRVIGRPNDPLAVGGQFRGEIDLGNGPLVADSSQSEYIEDIFLAACVAP
jgi:hypothetical protein